MDLKKLMQSGTTAKIILSAAALLAAAAILSWTYWPKAPQGAFFTTDDGKTFFEDAPRVTPCIINGKEAVQAAVFTCDGGQTKFVGYLRRYTSEGRAHAEAALKNPHLNTGPESGVEIKRPGDTQWVPAGGIPSGPPDNRANSVMDVQPPTGQHGNPVQIFPN